jgi:hypothetical protein
VKNWIATALALSLASSLATAALQEAKPAAKPEVQPETKTEARPGAEVSEAQKTKEEVKKATKPPKPADKEAKDAKDEKAKKEEDKPRVPWSADGWSGLTLRGIGPAVTSGRIADIAVDPTDKKRWFVAAASGGVFRTENAGTTWTPVFEGEASYSIGCVAIDPRNPSVVWVGSGENNSQRSVGYGDGVYKSEDGGKSWKNVGLKSSEHIARS